MEEGLKAYFISVMVACTIALSITSLIFAQSVLEYVAPESTMTEKDFVRYNSLEQYIEYKELISMKNKNPELYKGLTSEEWKIKWKRYRSGKVAAEKHSGIGGIYSSILSFAIFGFLFLLNFFLYKKLINKND